MFCRSGAKLTPQMRSPLRSAPSRKTASATEPIQVDHGFLGAFQSVSWSFPVLFWMEAYLDSWLDTFRHIGRLHSLSNHDGIPG